ncbi:MAG: proline--tRNA ligase, partial [Pseudomonadales bacterium]|nr:proline--tRNA ligase [Pseudomonadales bacterium]NIX08384.1 proline--tRNA ligase [Pseudomonadales bacterium]
GGNLSHEFIILADTGESEVFCHQDFVDVDVANLEVDYEDAAAVKKQVDYYTSLYARTDEKHDPAAFEAEVPEDKRV